MLTVAVGLREIQGTHGMESRTDNRMRLIGWMVRTVRRVVPKPMKLHLTRAIIKTCPIFGDPAEMSDRQLPTYNTVMKDFLHTRDFLKAQRRNQWQSVSEIAEIVSTRVDKIWRTASLPVVSHARIVQMVKSYHDKYLNLIKNYKRKMDDPRYKAKINDFVESSQTLFDFNFW